MLLGISACYMLLFMHYGAEPQPLVNPWWPGRYKCHMVLFSAHLARECRASAINLIQEACTGSAAPPISAGQSDKQVASWQLHIFNS